MAKAVKLVVMGAERAAVMGKADSTATRGYKVKRGLKVL